MSTLRKTAVPEEVLQGRTVFTVLGRSGDDRLIWDSADPEQVKEAIDKFDEYMEKGYIAFIVDEEGRQGDMVRKDDWKKRSVRQCEELLFEKDKVTNKPRGKEVQVVAPVVGG